MYHQCLKYFQDGQVKKIVADDKPFTVAESHFTDAKFYLKDDTIKETQVVASPSSKEEKLHSKAPRIDSLIEEKETKQTETSIEEKKQHTLEVARVALVLHYVLVAKRKESQSPFSGDEESISKDLQGLNLLVTKITKSRPSSQPLKGLQDHPKDRLLSMGLCPLKEPKRVKLVITMRSQVVWVSSSLKPLEKKDKRHRKPRVLGQQVLRLELNTLDQLPFTLPFEKLVFW